MLASPVLDQKGLKNFDVFLTMHLSKVLVTDQLSALILVL